jgi:hypothetical protein
LNYVTNNEDMITGSIRASVSKALPLILGFLQPAGQDKEHPYVRPAVPDGGVSDLEVLNSHAAKLAKEDLDQLGALGNKKMKKILILSQTGLRC